MQNAPHLITYLDRLAGDLKGLARLMDGTLKDAFAGVHVLPFYVRLDAVGYAIKRPGTSSFMIPETFQFIERLSNECHRRGMEVLVEMHGHYQTQIEVADKVDYVYDFALPPWCSTRCTEVRLAPSRTGSRSGRTTW